MRNMTIFHISISTQNPQPLPLPYMMLWFLCRVTDTESGRILWMRNMTIFHISISTQNPQPLALVYMTYMMDAVELLSQNPVVFLSCASRCYLRILWTLMYNDVNIVEPCLSHQKQNNFIGTKYSASQAKWVQDRWSLCADPALRLLPLYHSPWGCGGHAWQAAFLPDELLKQC